MTVVAPDDARVGRTYRRITNSRSRQGASMTTFDSTPPSGAPKFPLGRYTVLNALQLDLIECSADAAVRSIARTMAEHTVHGVVVRNLESGAWGIVSDLD